jgi:hypothetical protein
MRTVTDAARLLAAPDDGADALRGVEAAGGDGMAAALWLDPVRQSSLQRALRRWRRTASPLGAEALRGLGVAEGPALGATLHRLRRERYLGTLANAAGARRRVQTWLREGTEAS